MTSGPEPATAPARWRVPGGVRVVVSAALLGWLLTRVPLVDVARTARTADAGMLGIAVVAIVAGQVLRAVRTCALLRAGVRSADVRAMLRMQMLAFLPGMLSPAKAGELLKVELMRREWNVSLARGTAVFLAERVVDVALLGACGLWALVVVFGRAVPGGAYAVAAAAVAGVVLGVAMLRAHVVSDQTAARIRAALADVRWLPMVSSSLAYWALVVGIVWLFVRSLGGAAPFASLAGMVPLSLITALLPISIGGFGVREGAMVVLFQHESVGCTEAQALAVSVLYDVLGLGVPALMGVGYTLAGGRRA